jgi:hypothetical protein
MDIGTAAIIVLGIVFLGVGGLIWATGKWS